MKVAYLMMCLVGLVTVGCGGDRRQPAFTVDGQLSKSDAALASGATRTLLATCPALISYAEDFVGFSFVKLREATLDDQRERGWMRAVEVEMVVVDHPKSIPREFKAAGHHCYFDVGVAAPLGVSIAKRPCVALCKGLADTSGLAFFPAPSH